MTDKKKNGRPSTYSDEIAARICDEIADGKSLRTICAAEDMPVTSTVCLWLTKHKDFSEQYTRAREAQADTLFDEVLAIADDSNGDIRVDKDGKEIVDHENIQRSRLRVDARKWMAGKLRPKKYGERLELAGDKENPLEMRLSGAKAILGTKLARIANTKPD